MWKLALIVPLFFTLSACGDVEGKVVAIHDGDTITVLDANKVQHKIRLNGIDAPETGQDFGSKAKQALSSLIFGKQVKVIGQSKDRYKRVLGSVYLGSEKINVRMVRDGWAWHYTQYAKNDPDFIGAQKEAQKAKRGLWAQENPTPPWEWRTKQAEERKKK